MVAVLEEKVIWLRRLPLAAAERLFLMCEQKTCEAGLNTHIKKYELVKHKNHQLKIFLLKALMTLVVTRRKIC